MERPERPSRPEKPNRDTLRNSIRIRRRISSLLYEMGSQDSTDSDSEDVSSVPSPSRRPVPRRYTDLRGPYSGGPSDSQDTLRHHSSPPDPVSPDIRSYVDVLRSEPSSSSLLYTLQPFRSPQRPLPVSMNHPLPMFHHHHHHHPSSASASFDPLTNSSRNRDFNILVQSTAGSGALRESHTERDRPSMSGTTFLVCDENSSINPPKRFCPNSNGNMMFSSPRQQNSFSSSMLRDRSDPLPSTSSAAGAAEDLTMTISSMTRDTDRRLPNNDGLPSFTVQNSGERGVNASFITTLDSSRDDSLDGSDAVSMNREEGASGGGGGSGGFSVPPTPPRSQFFAMSSLSGGFSDDWMNPTRVNSRGPSSNRMALGRNLSSRSSFILRAVDELEEARLRNRGMIIDDEVLDEDVMPSSRPASDSDGIDEDVRTAVTNLEFLRDGGNSNDILSQVEVDRDRGASSHGHGQQPADQAENREDQSQLMNIRFDHDHHSDEEVVLISVNGLSSAGALGRDENEELSDENSGTTEPPDELSNEPFEVSNISSQRGSGNSHADGAVSNSHADEAVSVHSDMASAATCLKAAAADDGQDFNAKLLALLECPVCLETIVPPIHQCRKGHPVCSVCRPRLTVCPTCRSRFTETRNLLMEKVADMMQFPCKNYVVGCTVSTALKDKTAHELGCGYRQYSCIDRDCQWKGFKQELLVHCNKLHLDKVIISPAAMYCNLIIPFELHRQSSWVMSTLDEVFLVTFKVYPHNILRGCTVFLGPPENALKYNYYFKFGGKKRNKCFKYREMTIPHKASIHSNEFFQDTCFSYQFDPNTFKLVNGKTIIEGMVAVTKVTQRSAR